MPIIVGILPCMSGKNNILGLTGHLELGWGGGGGANFLVFLYLYMTHVVTIDILTGYKEKGNLHFILKIIFHCIFIGKPCIFSKLLQYILSVEQIA